MIGLKNIFKKNKERTLFIVFFLINLLILCFSNYKDGGDDLFYKNATLDYSWWSFLTTRYLSWTGRMIPELMAYFFGGSLIFIWPVVNALVITILAVLIFKYINLFTKLNSNKKLILALVACLSFLMLNKSVIEPAVVWHTGSTNYLWPTTFGFAVFYPFLLFIKNKLNKKNYLFYFGISILVAISTEQVSVALTIGIITYFGFMLINKKKIPSIIYLTSLTILMGSLILFMAPGNQIRMQSEASRNFPEFFSL